MGTDDGSTPGMDAGDGRPDSGNGFDGGPDYDAGERPDAGDGRPDAGGGFDGGPDYDAGERPDAGGGETDAGGGGTDAGPPRDAGTGGPCSGAGDCAFLNSGAHCSGDSLVDTAGVCVGGTCMAVERRIEDCTAMTMPHGCDADAISEDTGYCDSSTNSCRTMRTRIPCGPGTCTGTPTHWAEPERCFLGFDGITGMCARPGPGENCIVGRTECEALYVYRTTLPTCDPTTGCGITSTTVDCRDVNGTSCDAADPTHMAIRRDCICSTLSPDGCQCRDMRSITCGTAVTACIDGTRLLDCTASASAFCIDSSSGGGGLCSNCVVTTCSSACVMGATGGSCS
ncbi:MAG: hypothetical protein H6719_08605 [Sandaracinaceae bacterium]|nr:hypothetical protein [Sandaracinaceae bacterium]